MGSRWQQMHRAAKSAALCCPGLLCSLTRIAAYLKVPGVRFRRADGQGASRERVLRSPSWAGEEARAGRLSAALALAALGVLVGLALAAAPALAAQETYAFDPVRSLTGGCVVTAEDAVPDPGCPEDHAPDQFSRPAGVATDTYGNSYVANEGAPQERLDLFDASGHWILTASMRDLLGQLSEDYKNAIRLELQGGMAVDSLGNLYLGVFIEPEGKETIRAVIRYTPNSYPPDTETKYGSPFTVVSGHFVSVAAVAVGPNDHLYVDTGSSIDEYDSANEGNGLLRTGIGAGILFESKSIAIGSAGEIFASGLRPGAGAIPTKEKPFVSQVYVFDGESGLLKDEIDGSGTDNCAEVKGEKECGFGSSFGKLGLAVEWASGEVFVNDEAADKRPAVYQFRFDEGTEEYVHLSTIEHFFQDVYHAIAIDNGAFSPEPGYLFVTSHPSGVGHHFAFKPLPPPKPPIVQGQDFSGVSTSEALLEAEINPNGKKTRYRFEYVEEDTYLEDIEALGPGHGFDHAARAPEPDASLALGSGFVPAFVPLAGLEPGTTYRFRAVAENCDAEEPGRPCITMGEGKPGEEGDDARFATYPAQPPSPPCPNEAFRSGPSAALPDCRAYELVTPGDTNGHPVGANALIGLQVGAAWSFPLASASGNSIVFQSFGGSLPGFEGSGVFNTEGYRAQRDPVSGWHTEIAGPSGAQSEGPTMVGVSPDHSHWVWKTFHSDEGSLGPDAYYLRQADHSFQPVGRGSLEPAGDTKALARWISAGGTHIVFTSKVQLEENAPPSGTTAIYDYSPMGPTQVVSLLPGEVPLGAGQNASYQGASADGSTVAFKVGGTLYARVDNMETVEVSSEETLFAGLSEDGRWLFYLRPSKAAEGLEPAQGDIFAFDTSEGEAAEPIEAGSGGESIPVNVSPDGSAVYFVSPKQLEEGSAAGEDNLYLWERASESIRFIATLEHTDVTGVKTGTEDRLGGLGLWVSHAVSPNQGGSIAAGIGRGSDPSRTTPDGSAFVFESHANLTEYDSQGRRQIYRYDAADESLRCISCNPTLAPPAGDAKLQSLDSDGSGGLLNALVEIANVSADGRKVFFESLDPLVPADVNGLRDVYEWRAEGVGACGDPGGCLALISSGQGARDSFLYGVTPDGHDVFLLAVDTLLPSDTEAVISVYDARVDGGFDETPQTPCQGEACKEPASTQPNLPAAGSTAFQGPGNRLRPKRRCPKGKRLVRRAGKVRCVKRAKGQRRQRRRGEARAGR